MKKKFSKKHLQLILPILIVTILTLFMLWACAAPNSNSKGSDSGTDNVLTDNSLSKAVVLGLSSVPMTDIAACYPHIWGLSTEVATNQGDYWIYYYNIYSGKWVKTTHWGAAVSVTSDGTCYHFNKYYNQIWYCAPGSNTPGYNIPLDQNMGGTIVDIASGNHSNTTNNHSIWVTMAYQSMYDIYKYNDGAQAPGWHEIEYSDFWPSKVSCDPWSGDLAAFVGVGPEIHVFSDYGSGSGKWLTFNGPPAGHDPMDIGITSIDISELITTDADGGLWKTDVNDNCVKLKSDAHYYGVCGDHYYYYYLLSSNKTVRRGTW